MIVNDVLAKATEAEWKEILEAATPLERIFFEIAKSGGATVIANEMVPEGAFTFRTEEKEMKIHLNADLNEVLKRLAEKHNAGVAQAAEQCSRKAQVGSSSDPASPKIDEH